MDEEEKDELFTIKIKIIKTKFFECLFFKRQFHSSLFFIHLSLLLSKIYWQRKIRESHKKWLKTSEMLIFLAHKKKVNCNKKDVESALYLNSINFAENRKWNLGFFFLLRFHFIYRFVIQLSSANCTTTKEKKRIAKIKYCPQAIFVYATAKWCREYFLCFVLFFHKCLAIRSFFLAWIFIQHSAFLFFFSKYR